MSSSLLEQLYSSHDQTTLLEQLLAPAYHVLDNYTRAGRDCPEISDRDFIALGVRRTVSQCRSGRDFIQQERELSDSPLRRASFFDALHSSRRLELSREVSWQLNLHGRQHLQDADRDLLAAFPELKDLEIWAGDGHKVQHACHALRDSKGRHVAPNTLYLLCLHTGLMLNLAPVQGDGQYRHEINVFRRTAPSFLKRLFGSKNKTKKNKPLLFVLDPGFQDNEFWQTLAEAQQCGANLIIRAKANMVPKPSTIRSFDEGDPVNTGVDADLEVRFGSGGPMRLVRYTDPETHETYHFITTDFELRPGVIAWLYLLRWRIEKLFDTSKNKLEETKAWAGGEVAREQQAHFLAMTHNLLVLFRDFMDQVHGAKEEKLGDKRRAYLQRRQAQAEEKGRRIHPLHWQMPMIVQLSVQFIRSLRNLIARNVSLRDALPRIRTMLVAYL